MLESSSCKIKNKHPQLVHCVTWKGKRWFAEMAGWKSDVLTKQTRAARNIIADRLTSWKAYEKSINKRSVPNWMVQLSWAELRMSVRSSWIEIKVIKEVQRQSIIWSRLTWAILKIHKNAQCILLLLLFFLYCWRVRTVGASYTMCMTLKRHKAVVDLNTVETFYVTRFVASKKNECQ